MVTSIQELIEIIAETEIETKIDKFTQVVLESIAAENDSRIMRDLMFEVVHRNALLNKQLEINLEEIKRLSVTDELTGIYNRRRFIEVLHTEYDRKTRYGNKFSIIMFDIDHFKNVNDTYGHDIGDFVLRDLADIVKSRLRDSDIFARWGGEEFMVLVPESNSEEAFEVAEMIRKLIECHDFSPVPQITSSFGVITYCEEDEMKLDEITIFVDQALYNAKETGRNKVVVYHKELYETVKD